MTKRRVQILSDGRTVWVNAADGTCIGRYLHSKLFVHMDVHHDTVGQRNNSTQCLDCASGATWSEFKSAMLEHHGVVVSDRHKPALA